jgi:hypothetical protein
MVSLSQSLTVKSWVILLLVLLISVIDLCKADNIDFSAINFIPGVVNNNDNREAWGLGVDPIQPNLIYLYGHTTTAFGRFTAQDLFGEEDIFLIKMDVNGTWIWWRIIGTPANEKSMRLYIGNDVIADPVSGNVWIHGTSTGRIGNHTVATANYRVGFISRFNGNNGSTQLTHVYGADNVDIANNGLWLSDDSSTIFASGSASGVFGGAAKPAANWDCFLTRYTLLPNNTIVQVWNRLIGSNSNDHVSNLAVDPVANLVYIAGQVQGLMIGATYSGNSDTYIGVFNATNGNLLRNLTFGGDGADPAYDIAASPSKSGEFYVVGTTNNGFMINGQSYSTIAPPNTNGPFIVKFNVLQNGSNPLWVRLFGSSASGSWSEAFAVKIHPVNGDIYVGGYTNNILPVNPDEPVRQSTYGGNDFTLTRFRPADGFLLWTKSAGTTNRDHARRLIINSDGTVYMAGRMNNEVGFAVYSEDSVNYAQRITVTSTSIVTRASVTLTVFVTQSAGNFTQFSTAYPTATVASVLTVPVVVSRCENTATLYRVVETCLPNLVSCKIGSSEMLSELMNHPEFVLLVILGIIILLVLLITGLYCWRRERQNKDKQKENYDNTIQSLGMLATATALSGSSASPMPPVPTGYYAQQPVSAISPALRHSLIQAP